MSLASLNSSGVQTSNPALYQSITDLIKQANDITNSLNSQIAAIQAIIDSYGIVINLNQFELTKSAPLLIDGGQIKFPATQNPSTDANTLDDYEEGIWTPTDASGAGLVFATFDGSYVKIGRMVHLQGFVLYPATASGLAARLSTPFVTSGDTGLALRFSNSGASFTASMPGAQSFVEFYTPAGANKSNTSLATFFVAVSGTYRVSA